MPHSMAVVGGGELRRRQGRSRMSYVLRDWLRCGKCQVPYPAPREAMTTAATPEPTPWFSQVQIDKRATVSNGTDSAIMYAQCCDHFMA